MAERTLRPEARPVEWEGMDAAQKEAFKEVLGLLDAAVEELSRLKEEGIQRGGGSFGLPLRLDPRRPNRVIFLEGGRGTGKTTVLLSLLQALGDPGWRCPDDVNERLGQLRPRIVVLEPLDMEPLPAPANLLAAVLTRIEQAVERLLQDLPSRPSWPGEGDELLKLRQFAADIAMSWEGNLMQRAGRVDPEEFASEVLILERARLSLPERLGDILESLSGALEKTGRLRDTLFLLPVDDFDLNPARALELLRLLRMISVPRLLFLIVGDLRVAEEVFGLNASGELAGLVKGASGASLPFPEGSVGGLARHIASHALRKLVPPHQRVRLEPLDVREALKRLSPLFEWIPVKINSAYVTTKNGIEIPRVAGKEVLFFNDFLCIGESSHERRRRERVDF